MFVTKKGIWKDDSKNCFLMMELNKDYVGKISGLNFLKTMDLAGEEIH